MPLAVMSIRLCTSILLHPSYSFHHHCSAFVLVPHPPALLASLQTCVFPYVFSSFLLSRFLFLLFYSLACLFRFRVGRQLIYCYLFLIGIMLSPRFMLRLIQGIVFIWYVRTLISRVLFVRCLRFVSIIVCRFVFSFSSWDDLPLLSYWDLSCDHGLHCGHEVVWEQQRPIQEFNCPSLDDWFVPIFDRMWRLWIWP